eukprot:TRINITY_DN20588_c0_g1_i1.p1 TRINITY_DN20588_c0_g1~~TRINITY_DN20588_c0_g1_i1.p1  ORF type:complete len:218 (-),score=58.68 TRINITY_DN20588_c0_g1_i1:6-659(-)
MGLGVVVLILVVELILPSTSQSSNSKTFLIGDAIPTKSRFKGDKYSGPWIGLVGHTIPRFRVPSSKKFTYPNSEEDPLTKLQFNFLWQFKTPWFALTQKSTQLSDITFTFIYKNDQITELNWDTYYVPLNDTHPEHIELTFHYLWEQSPEADYDRPLRFLFVCSFLLSVTALVLSTTDEVSKNTTRPEPRSKTLKLKKRQSDLQVFDEFVVGDNKRD